MKIQGKVWKYGDDINTDVLFPGKYTYTIKERSEMAKVAGEDLDPQLLFQLDDGFGYPRLRGVQGLGSLGEVQVTPRCFLDKAELVEVHIE